VVLRGRTYLSPVASEFNLRATAKAVNVTFEETGTSNASQGATLNALNLAALNVTGGSVGSTTNITEAGSETWVSDSMGTVEFTNTFALIDAPNGRVNMIPGGGTSFAYEFFANVDGDFVIDWDINVTDSNSNKSMGNLLFRWTVDGTPSTLNVNVSSSSGDSSNLFRVGAC